MKANDDEEPTRWTSIGWQAALILNRLRNEAALTSPEKRDVDEGAEEGRDAAREQREKDERDFIEKRIAEIERFERRINGGRKNTFRR